MSHVDLISIAMCAMFPLTLIVYLVIPDDSKADNTCVAVCGGILLFIFIVLACVGTK